MKKNCWEVKKCGREPGGQKVAELGVCSAATEARLDGVHGGRKAGRACWVVAGTLCGGKEQGTFAMKMNSCSACAFYEQVKAEEAGGFTKPSVLLSKIH